MTATSKSPAGAPDSFTPALGRFWLTPFYDFAIAGFTRERTWRGALIALVKPQPEDRILDIGCGTGTLAAALGAVAEVVGLDPDPDILKRARAKAGGARVRFVEGFFGAARLPAGWRPTKIVSSLVLHQTPLAEKRRIIEEAFAALPPDGTFCLADYGRQPSPLQRFLFRHLVQRVDGFANTQPNADGAVDRLLAEAGFEDCAPAAQIPTATGTISLWRARKPSKGDPT